eukprot:SM000027S09684  [mRNA]  locus=s27:721560:723314:- [translate_table: standard]
MRQAAARWPSAARRTADLEQRLRELADHLVAKQAQAEALASERAVLQHRLSVAAEARRTLQAGADSDHTDLARNRRPAANGSHGALLSLLEDGRSVGRQRGAGAGAIVAGAAWRADALSRAAGERLQRSALLRSLAAGYVLALHLAAFAILSWAAAQRALKGRQV